MSTTTAADPPSPARMLVRGAAKRGAVSTHWDATRAVTLGLVGGYVDTVGYIMLRGLFPNHVTGNLPIAAANPGWSAIPLLVMVPLWLVAVIAAAAVAGRLERRSSALVLPAVIGAEAALLGLFLLLGVALIPDRDASTLLTQTIVGAAGVSAMGVQSVVTRLGGYVFPTTMVTGTLTLLGMDGAQALFGQHPNAERAVVVRRIKAFSRVVVAFGAGAGLGGLMASLVDFWAMSLPVAAVALCAYGEFTTGRRARR
jgi:uncharacterized membrane protein YoaK (UPF0700 family)